MLSGNVKYEKEIYEKGQENKRREVGFGGEVTLESTGEEFFLVNEMQMTYTPLPLKKSRFHFFFQKVATTN